LRFGPDPVGAAPEIWARVEEYLAEEGVEFVFDRDTELPDQIGPRDLLVRCEVARHHYGDWLLRRLLRWPLSMAGACRLKVVGEVRDGQGNVRPFQSSVSRVGWIDKSYETVMGDNIKAVASDVARRVTRHVADRWLINAFVYRFACLSVSCGLLSLIPLLGLLVAPSGITLSLLALGAIWNRNLPKRQATAIAGLILNLAGVAITVLVCARSPWITK